jgi:hypothetical protein
MDVLGLLLPHILVGEVDAFNRRQGAATQQCQVLSVGDMDRFKKNVFLWLTWLRLRGLQPQIALVCKKLLFALQTYWRLRVAEEEEYAGRQWDLAQRLL